MCGRKKVPQVGTSPATKPVPPCKPGVSGPQRAGTVGAQKSANRLGPGSSSCSQVVHRRQEARQGGEIISRGKGGRGERGGGKGRGEGEGGRGGGKGVGGRSIRS